MNATSLFLSIRAIGAEFARRTWSGIAILVLLVAGVIIALLWWLTSMSAWWWLLAAPFGIGLSVAGVLLLVFWLLIRHVRPLQTKEQAQQVRAFVDKLQFASEITSTPNFIVLFRTIRSIAAPRSDTYLRDIFETKDLKKDFTAIAKTFRDYGTK